MEEGKNSTIRVFTIFLNVFWKLLVDIYNIAKFEF